MNEKILNELFKLSNKALKKKEMPVSAIIIYNNKIIAKAYNKKNISKNSLYHAEILCIQRAYKKLKNWNLNGCKMYISLEPCEFCKYIIQESRIENVYFILKKGENTNKYYKTTYEQMFVSNGAEFKYLIQSFFSEIRK